MTTKAFTKGQLVTLFRNWDSKGTVRVQDLIVYSCGAKQMVLVDATGTKFKGSFFDPNRSDIWTAVLPRQTETEAQAVGLKMAENFLAYERAHIAVCLEKWGDAPGYRQAMERKLSELHEPTVIRAAA